MRNAVEALVGFIFTLAVVSATAASADEYLVKFREGYYKFDVIKPFDSPDNKYLAKISIEVNGNVISDDVRGSTLPDSAFYYIMWHSGNSITAPNDTDVGNIFAHYTNRWQALIDELKTRDDLFKRNSAAIQEWFITVNSIPVIWSGKYTFTMGLHHNGQSVHGKPYVPRLFGGPNQGDPYNGRSGKGPQNTVGGYIVTINANKAQAFDTVADGINVHDGRRKQDYKDSEGCLTIHPDDWPKFYGKLPSPEAWIQGKHRGQVQIIREGQATQGVAPEPPTPRLAPSNINVR